MSHNTGTFCTCPELQADLFRHFDSCDHSKQSRMSETSFVQFLMSDINTNGMLQQKMSPGNTKRRTVELVYSPRPLTSEYSSTPSKVCTSTTDQGTVCQTYTLGNAGVQKDWRMDVNDLRDICKDNDLFIAEMVQKEMNGALRKMDEDLVTDLVTLVGNFASDETNVNANNEKVVSSKLANGQPNSDFYEDVSFAAMAAGYCDIPFAFGWREAFRAFRRVEAGCCADTGLNLNELAAQFPTVFLPNSNIESVFGANHFITLAPGAVQLIRWNEFEGSNVLDDDAYKQNVIFEPLTGIPFDIQITNNCGVWSFNLKLVYQLEGLPTDMFSVGDPLAGVTSVNEFLITNP